MLQRVSYVHIYGYVHLNVDIQDHMSLLAVVCVHHVGKNDIRLAMCCSLQRSVTVRMSFVCVHYFDNCDVLCLDLCSNR